MTNDHLTAPEIDVLSRTVSGIILGIGALAAFSVVVSPFRDDLNTGTIALILLVPVLISTVGGIAAALVVAALGAATFNFFFTQPYHSFRIDSGESSGSSPAPPSEPAPAPRQSAAPVVEGESPTFSNNEASTQAAALQQAAQKGLPFCEVCANA